MKLLNVIFFFPKKSNFTNFLHFFGFYIFQGTYLDTIIPREDLPENRDALPEIGQRARLSKGDILQTMALYGCPSNLT